MNRPYLTNYQPLEGSGTAQDKEDDDLSPDIPTNIMIHHVPESGKKRWNHIEDLDSFFTRIYQYHQHKGFLCMIVEQLLGLGKFIFIIGFTTFLITSVDFAILFRNKPPHGHPLNFYEKTTLLDCIYSMDVIRSHFNWRLYTMLIFALLFLCLKLGQSIMNFFYFREIKLFYEVALGIKDCDIVNVTWEEVQQRVMEVQVEQRMCIHKETLTELDVNHRILRFTNYFIAMVNKNLIPLKLEVPFIGEILFLTRGLQYNLEFILFWGPWAPFKNNWHLTDEYKRYERRHELAEQLRKRILYIGIANLILSPFILIWHVLYSFYSNAELLKRDPSVMGLRRWSHYGEVYLRHFNELDHELRARLSRGYKASCQYMKIFTSRLTTLITEFIAFILGSFLAVLVLLTVIDEDVIQIEHVIGFITITTVIVMVARSFIPDENLVWCPELLLRRVLAEIHYLPDSWRGRAHTSQVREEFSRLFQYKLVHIFEELMSPLVTPYILCIKLAQKSLDIVDFYRNFTLEVTGVGDICSFAQMDIRRHGCQTWQPDMSDYDLHHQEVDDLAMRTDGGKTELSLLHFTLTNPNWRPPQESSTFLNALKTRAQRDFTTLTTLDEENPLAATMDSLNGSFEYGAIGNSVFCAPWIKAKDTPLHQCSMRHRQSHMQESLSEGNQGILASLSNSVVHPPNSTLDPYNSPRNSLLPQLSSMQPQDLAAIDVSFSTLYLHELHQRRRARAQYIDAPLVGCIAAPGPLEQLAQTAEQETTPSAEEISYFPTLLPQDDTIHTLPARERTPLLKDT